MSQSPAFSELSVAYLNHWDAIEAGRLALEADVRRILAEVRALLADTPAEQPEPRDDFRLRWDTRWTVPLQSGSGKHERVTIKIKLALSVSPATAAKPEFRIYPDANTERLSGPEIAKLLQSAKVAWAIAHGLGDTPPWKRLKQDLATCLPLNTADEEFRKSCVPILAVAWRDVVALAHQMGVEFERSPFVAAVRVVSEVSAQLSGLSASRAGPGPIVSKGFRDGWSTNKRWPVFAEWTVNNRAFSLVWTPAKVADTSDMGRLTLLVTGVVGWTSRVMRANPHIERSDNELVLAYFSTELEDEVVSLQGDDLDLDRRDNTTRMRGGQVASRILDEIDKLSSFLNKE